MSYEVYFTDIALKSLKRYSKKDQSLILDNIEKLAESPSEKSNVKKLVNFDKAAYRLRIGNYRVLFDKEDELKIIDIIDVLPRQRVYKRK